jgi:hypothetical protein
LDTVTSALHVEINSTKITRTRLPYRHHLDLHHAGPL